MKSGTSHDLSHICFEGKEPARRQRSYARRACPAVLATPRPPRKSGWTTPLHRLGIGACRTGRRGLPLPAAASSLAVLLEGYEGPIDPGCPRTAGAKAAPRRASAVSSLLIGVTEFFREPAVFDFLRTQVLPVLAGGNRRLRIWSAACSSGAELYSMAILLSETGLLERSYLLGTDCRGDAIERARLGLYDATALKLVQAATRDKPISSQPGRIGGRSRPSAGRSTGKSQTCWRGRRRGRGTSFCGGMRPSTSSPVPRK